MVTKSCDVRNRVTREKWGNLAISIGQVGSDIAFSSRLRSSARGSMQKCQKSDGVVKLQCLLPAPALGLSNALLDDVCGHLSVAVSGNTGVAADNALPDDALLL